jgi:C-terminal processing protease CtpA/Prc
VTYSPVKLPPEDQKPTPEQDMQYQKMLERTNCAFQKVEILSHNIGYLKLNAFLDPTRCGATLVAAMNFLAHVDAIIFDLRQNGGGDPKMVATVSTYLFDKPTHLNDLYNRKEDSTTQYWTLPYVPGAILAGKPAFVLTSKATFSGAEEFAYDLKNLKRATIVGEITGGGAHPAMGRRIDDHFIIGVPFARAINPISKTDWEGRGVEPDVSVKADDALEKATGLAASKLTAQQ